MTEEPISAFCGACRAYHLAEVIERDSDGWPEVTRFLIPCQSADREGLGREAGSAFAIGVDVGDWELVEKAAELGLSVNDPKAAES